MLKKMTISALVMSGQWVLAGIDSTTATDEKLTARETRICVTGHDHNRPEPLPGMGNFIGWAEFDGSNTQR